MNIRFSITALLACVAISATILVATPLPARADDLLDDHQHMPLINTGSAKCFEPTPQGGASDWTGLPIQQRTCSPRVIRPEGTIDRPIQYYLFQSQQVEAPTEWYEDAICIFGCITLYDTVYLIKNQDSNLCLDVRDGSKSNWAVVQQSTCDKNSRSMLWYVKPGDFPGMFKVRNLNSNRCLDVKGGSSAEYAQLQQYHCNSTNLAQNFSQKFPTFWTDAAGNVKGMVDLNGKWTDGSTRSAVIYAGLGSVVIDMSAFNRHDASGQYFDTYFISVKFPDDATFTGELLTKNKIKWSNGSVWTKKP